MNNNVFYIILQIVFAPCKILKIGVYSWTFPSFSWGVFGHMMCLDESCTSENIILMDYSIQQW